MRVIDLGNGQEEYDDEIYDRRGGRGRSRRSDAPEGTAFVRYLAVRCFVGDTIKWSDMI